MNKGTGASFKRRYFKFYEEGVEYTEKDLPKELVEIIDSLPKNGSILDVGCANGVLLRFVHKRRRDIKLYGVDVGDVEGLIPSYIKFTKCSGDDIPLENRVFNLVTCLHVLEHIPNPHDFLIEFHRVLKPGGTVYIETPYYKMINVTDEFRNFWNDPTHIRPYTKGSIRRLLEENNFSVIKIDINRDLSKVAIGPYLLLKWLILRDSAALITFQMNFHGHAVWGIGKK